MMIAGGLALGGCASLSPDAGMGTVQGIVASDLGKSSIKVESDAAAADAGGRVARLLKASLTADAAVQVAIFSNRGLQAEFDELGIADAQRLAASLPPNPKFSAIGYFASNALEIDGQIAASILALATLPARREIAGLNFESAKLRTAEAVLRLAAQTRRQYFRAVAATEQLAVLEQARASSDVAAELTKKLGEAGTLNKLDQAREFAFQTELGAQVARARLSERLERERLSRLMGLWGGQIAYKLPRALPALPKSVKTARDIEGIAIERRIDLKLARASLSATARQFGLTEATRYVNDVELVAGAQITRDVRVDGAGVRSIDRAYKFGPGVNFEIPLFDFGQARVAEAEQTYLREANRLAEKAVTIRSEVREAYQAYKGAYDIARYYETKLLPLRRIIQDQSLLQYSGMLIDVSTLLVDARARVFSLAQAVDAKREFWLAEVDLKHATVGGGVLGVTLSVSAAAPGAGG